MRIFSRLVVWPYPSVPRCIWISGLFHLTLLPARSDQHAHSVVQRRFRPAGFVWANRGEETGASEVWQASGPSAPCRRRSAAVAGRRVSPRRPVGWTRSGIYRSPGSLGGGSLGYASRLFWARSLGRSRMGRRFLTGQERSSRRNLYPRPPGVFLFVRPSCEPGIDLISSMIEGN